MRTKINVNLLKDFLTEEDFNQIDPFIIHASKLLLERNGRGSEFTGWLHWPTQSLGNAKLLSEIQDCKKDIDAFSPDYIVVVGIGGSYLGTKAVYDALKDHFPDKNKREILFAGHHLDPSYHQQLLAFLEDKNFAVVVISKSGTTTEPAIAFRLLRALLQKKHGSESRKRIVAITDAKKGALRSLCDKENLRSFVIDDDIGGRFSVFTPVGLVPLALAGFNIEEMLKGASDAETYLCSHQKLEDNPALKYAAIRNLLYQKGKPIELQSTFYPSLSTISEWWKQLFGESEGKEHKGIFPASLTFTSDLHSLGQFVQDGLRVFFETFITVKNLKSDIEIPLLDEDSDGLNYLAGENLSYVNNRAEIATQLAHSDGGVPVIEIEIPDITEYSISELLYFFEFSCAVSAYTLQVNPFDQPGVEAYKKNMFALLGKEGYEELKEKLEKRLDS